MDMDRRRVREGPGMGTTEVIGVGLRPEATAAVGIGGVSSISEPTVSLSPAEKEGVLRRLGNIANHFDAERIRVTHSPASPKDEDTALRYPLNSERWTNWAQIHTCVPKYYHQPSSIEEIVQIVRFARSKGERIRVVGSSHSPSDIAKTEGHMINLDRFSKVLSIGPLLTRSERDRDLPTSDVTPYAAVTVQAGIRIRDLNEELSRASPPLALSVLGSISDQSLAGAISTGTHGTGMNLGCLSTYVCQLELITGTGELVSCSRDHNSELFKAALCSVGALGIIVQITIRCEPAFRLHARQYPEDFEKVACNINSIATSAEHARFWWFPHTDKCLIWQADRTERPADPEPHEHSMVKQWYDYMKDTVVGYRALEASLYVSSWLPRLDPAINAVYQKLLFNTRQEKVGRSDRIFNFNCLFKQYVNEWAIPIEETESALRELRDMISRMKLNVHFPVEVRFVRGDDAMLSPCYGRDSCYIGIIMYRPYGREPSWKRYFHAFEELMARHSGRPHWAKEFAWREADLRKIYPRWEDFLRLERRCDPDRVFWNNFMERVFQPKLLPSPSDSDPEP